MPSQRDTKRPSERLIGARFRIRGDKATDASALFEVAGYQPIFVEDLPDGNVMFCFGKLPRHELTGLGEVIPLDYYVARAMIV